MALLVSPKKSMPFLIVLVVIVHFSIQFLSQVFYTEENPMLGSLVYVLAGGLDLLVAAHLYHKSLTERSQQSLFMGIGTMYVGVVFILLGLGLAGLFGPSNALNSNLGMYLLVSGMLVASFFLCFTPPNVRLRSGAHWIIISLVWLVVFLVGLYQFHESLPQLYAEGLPTLFRQQLITVIMVLLFAGAFRIALANKTDKGLPESVQWYVVGLSVLCLVMFNFLLSGRQGDEYSWAGRFFHILASGAFIQYLWWDEKDQ